MPIRQPAATPERTPADGRGPREAVAAPQAARDAGHAGHADRVAQPVAADPLHGSPRQAAQRARIAAVFGPAAQLRGGLEDDETAPMQARRAPRTDGLPAQLRAGAEALSGLDLSDVRVHRNSDKPAQLQALAYAQGSDIHLGPGQDQHLPHEAWHVVQQRQGRVAPTRQLQQGVPVNDDAGLESEADEMGAQALRMATPPPVQARPVAQAAAMVGQVPIQGRFGFEVELPMLFVDLHNRYVPSLNGGPPLPMYDVPRDATAAAGATDVHNGPECHVNVDHSSPLDALFTAELQQYAIDNGLNANETASLLALQNALMPHKASIVEVVTDAWDESTLTRQAALTKIRAVIAWVRGLFDAIQGHQQAALGPAWIGSAAPQADMFQPRLGYFHATYGVKLSQVPRLFEETSRERKRLARYVKRNAPQKEHADNVARTHDAVGVARTALKGIKQAWPRVHGSKGWTTPDAEARFLGFLTLLCNYVLAFAANNAGNLAKQQVGMHYYKSDLYDVAQALPPEIITALQANGPLRSATINAIGAATGTGVNADLGGPLAGITLDEYLLQILTGNQGVLRQQLGDDLRDPLLEGSINPYSHKLGPDLLGPATHQEQGVVVENRHLEYMDPRYGALLDASEQQFHQDAAQYPPPSGGNPDTRTAHEKAIYDSMGARDEGPARRPIGEWEAIMIGIYDMIAGINR